MNLNQRQRMISLTHRTTSILRMRTRRALRLLTHMNLLTSMSRRQPKRQRMTTISRQLSTKLSDHLTKNKLSHRQASLITITSMRHRARMSRHISIVNSTLRRRIIILTYNMITTTQLNLTNRSLNRMIRNTQINTNPMRISQTIQPLKISLIPTHSNTLHNQFPSTARLISQSILRPIIIQIRSSNRHIMNSQRFRVTSTNHLTNNRLFLLSQAQNINSISLTTTRLLRTTTHTNRTSHSTRTAINRLRFLNSNLKGQRSHTKAVSQSRHQANLTAKKHNLTIHQQQLHQATHKRRRHGSTNRNKPIQELNLQIRIRKRPRAMKERITSSIAIALRRRCASNPTSSPHHQPRTRPSPHHHKRPNTIQPHTRNTHHPTRPHLQSQQQRQNYNTIMPTITIITHQHQPRHSQKPIQLPTHPSKPQSQAHQHLKIRNQM